MSSWLTFFVGTVSSALADSFTVLTNPVNHDGVITDLKVFDKDRNSV